MRVGRRAVAKNRAVVQGYHLFNRIATVVILEESNRFRREDAARPGNLERLLQFMRTKKKGDTVPDELWAEFRRLQGARTSALPHTLEHAAKHQQDDLER